MTEYVRKDTVLAIIETAFIPLKRNEKAKVAQRLLIKAINNLPNENSGDLIDRGMAIKAICDENCFIEGPCAVPCDEVNILKNICGFREEE